jgi:multidrug efflux system membrane fusion protein
MNKLNKKHLIYLIIGILLVLIIFHSCFRGSTQKTLPITVNVSPVMQKNVVIDATAIGNVEAYTTVSVKSQVEGVLLSANFEEGSMVKKGQLLFTIDPRPFTIALDQAQANLTKDQAQLLTATSAMQRNQALVKKGYVAAQTFDELKNNVTSLTATVNSDKAAIENAKLQLSYSTIYSPISGRTGEQLIEPGNLVKANDQPLVVINQVTPISITFTLPEEQLTKVQEAFAKGPVDVLISVDKSKNNYMLKGKLVFIDNTVDQATGTIQLKAEYSNEKSELWPGQFVKIKIPLLQINNAILVPTPAVQEGPNGSYVFTVDANNIVHIVPVKIEYAIDGKTVIKDNLKPGTLVVTVGQMQLREGTEVQPINEPVR